MRLKTFPNDWSRLTYDQVLKNIKYLLKHYKKYELSKRIGVSAIQIGDVHIEYFKNDKCLKINNRDIREMTVDDELWEEALDLYSRSALYKMGVKWSSDKKKIVSVMPQIFFALIFAGLPWYYACFRDKQRTEIVKEALDKYEQEKAKTNTITMDSLINQHVK